jgi:enoyl-CoA hydratase/carnithine racemase
MIFLGERVDAATAQRIGLVEEVVPTGEAKRKALEWATKVEGQSPSSLALCKRLVQASRERSMNSAWSLERELFVDLFDRQDQKEGVNAFLEKRKPVWKNA